MNDIHTRRAFLQAAAAAAGVAWAANLAQVDEALLAAQQAAAERPTNLKVFTLDQMSAVDALTARIIPSVDGRPGAREAGVVYFIDQALATFNASQKKLYMNGLKDLNRRAVQARKDSMGFTGLTRAEQDKLIQSIETTPFFESVRFHTIVGTFSLPTRGGNRDFAGWHMLGIEHQMAFQPPFGFYDADVNRTN